MNQEDGVNKKAGARTTSRSMLEVCGSYYMRKELLVQRERETNSRSNSMYSVSYQQPHALKRKQTISTGIPYPFVQSNRDNMPLMGVTLTADYFFGVSISLNQSSAAPSATVNYIDQQHFVDHPVERTVVGKTRGVSNR